MKYVAQKSDMNKLTRQNSGDAPSDETCMTSSWKNKTGRSLGTKNRANVIPKDSVVGEDTSVEEKNTCDVISIDSVFHGSGGNEDSECNHTMEVSIQPAIRSDGISCTRLICLPNDAILGAQTEMFMFDDEQALCARSSFKPTEYDISIRNSSKETINEILECINDIGITINTVNCKEKCRSGIFSKKTSIYNIEKIDNINHIYETIDYIHKLCKARDKTREGNKIPCSKSMDANVENCFSTPSETENDHLTTSDQIEKTLEQQVEDSNMIINGYYECQNLLPVSDRSSDSVHTLDGPSRLESKKLPSEDYMHSDEVLLENSTKDENSYRKECKSTLCKDNELQEKSCKDDAKVEDRVDFRKPHNGRVLFYGFHHWNEKHPGLMGYNMMMNKELSPEFFGFADEDSFNNALNAKNEVIVKPPITIGRSISFKCNMRNSLVPREKLISDAVLQIDWGQYQTRRKKRSIWTICCQV
ncbi:hypothetical protein BEWA_040950 [Theileria equi strain WA]|uniref:Uncharacterized protein n=1 Tax=Theileria equi strain WA TaxID=1537102 RepID=L1LF40_THEEQ|nr:hypothetical protein BEWA_040950 [Theileria equi strain WA]EKX74057.1 hypothetical protein BEWA_040950 [Theileria equi strain WA]|eukprot:XP_004833509.1 hypothetical protein BEWA_040950 [Theileria equi strain WA]